MGLGVLMFDDFGIQPRLSSLEHYSALQMWITHCRDVAEAPQSTLSICIYYSMGILPKLGMFGNTYHPNASTKIWIKHEKT